MSLLVIAWLTQVSRPGTQVEGCFKGCASLDTSHPSELRVLSLNILHGFPDFENLSTRLELIAEEVAHQGADVVLLQEVPWTWQLGSAARILAERTQMNYAYLRSNGNRYAILFEEGSAVLSRFPIIGVEFAELQPSAGWFENRTVLHATLEIPNGYIEVYVTHLTHRDGTTNRLQALRLQDYVEAYQSSHPAIIGGDFNATPDSPQIETLRLFWKDVFLATHATETGYTCCIDNLNLGPAEPLEKRIDYLFFREGFSSSLHLTDVQMAFDQPFKTAYGWQWVSDHIGLLAVFRISPTPKD